MIIKRIRALALATLLSLVPIAAQAAQSTVVMPSTGPMSLGTFVSTYLNPALQSLTTCWSGTVAPATPAPVAGQCWWDTSGNPYSLKYYDGTTWTSVGTLNTTTHAWSAAGGGLTVGTTTITSGTDKRILFDDAGVLQESATLTLNKTTGQLTNAQGTITTSQPLTLTQTWNAGVVAFTGALVNVTDTASAAGSLLADFQVAGASKFKIDKGGYALIGNPAAGYSNTGLMAMGMALGTTGANTNLVLGEQLAVYGSSLLKGAWIFGTYLKFDSATSIQWASTTNASSGSDLYIQRDAANTLALRNTTSAQKFSAYNTYTDASNYERGIFDWAGSANVLSIGTENLGTGVARNLRFLIGGASKLDYGITNAAGWSVVGTLSLAAGGVGAPSVNFSDAGTGFYRFGSNQIGVSFNGGIGIIYEGGAMGQIFTSGFGLGFSSGATIGGLDTVITRKAAGVVQFGTTGANALGGISPQTKAGAFVAADFPSGSWMVGRDTTNLTTKLYYNNAGTLMSVPLT